MITHVLALDPSGNFHEGKGTTGWVLMQLPNKLVARGCIYAADYKTAEEYWNKHIELLDYNFKRHKKNLMVIIEDYILYQNRAINQINSQIETCRLIGLLQWFCWSHRQAYILENAATVKTRWSDRVLLEKGIVTITNRKYVHQRSGLEMNEHSRDALRHALHFISCKNKKKQPVQKRRIKYFSNYKRRTAYD